MSSISFQYQKQYQLTNESETLTATCVDVTNK